MHDVTDIPLVSIHRNGTEEVQLREDTDGRLIPRRSAGRPVVGSIGRSHPYLEPAVRGVGIIAVRLLHVRVDLRI